MILFILADISSVKDVLLQVKELGMKARLYEPSLAKAGPHLQRLGVENDKERFHICCVLFSDFLTRVCWQFIALPATSVLRQAVAWHSILDRMILHASICANCVIV